MLEKRVSNKGLLDSFSEFLNDFVSPPEENLSKHELSETIKIIKEQEEGGAISEGIAMLLYKKAISEFISRSVLSLIYRMY